MDLPAAVNNYQFGERAKTGLLNISQLCIALPGFSEQERAGARRMLIMMMETFRAELQYAAHATGHAEFRKAENALNEAISLIESNQPEQASEKIAAAISSVTTPAQEAWQVLSEHGIL